MENCSQRQEPIMGSWIFSFFGFSIFCEKRKNRKMTYESEIISFFSFSNNSKKMKNSKISLLALYSIFWIFQADFKIRKMKKWSIFLTIFFFSIFVCTLKYVNMTRISNISCFRFCWKNEKLDWPKCARTALPVQEIYSFIHGLLNKCFQPVSLTDYFSLPPTYLRVAAIKINS